MVRKNILIGVIGSIIAFLVSILNIFFITHLVIKNLTTNDASAWFLFYSIAMLLYVFDFGLSPTLGREISFCHKNSVVDAKRIKSLLEAAIGVNLLLAIICFFLFLIVGLLYLSKVFPPVDYSVIKFSFMYFLGGGFFLFLNIPLFATNYGLGQVFLERMLRSFLLMITVITVYVFFKFSHDFESLCKIWLLINLVFHIFLRFLTLKKAGIHFFEISGHFAEAKIIISTGYRQGLVGFGAWAIFQAGYFIIAHQLGPSYVTQYAPLMQIAGGLITVSAVLQYSLVPFVSRLFTQQEFNKIADVALRFNKFILLIVITGSAYVFVNAPLFLKYWLGPSFHYSHVTLGVLLIMSILEINHVSIATVAMACGYLKFVKISWLGAALSFILAFAFAKPLGILGVALGLFLAQLTTNNWCAVYLSLKFLKIPFRRYGRTFFTSLLYAGMMCVIIVTSQQLYLTGIRLFVYTTLLMGFLFFLSNLFLFKQEIIRLWKKNKASNFI